MNALKKFWKGWKSGAQAIGDTFARALLTVFYLTIFLPFGLGTTLFGDRLDIKKWQGNNSTGRATWLARSTKDQTVDDARRQS